MIALGILIAIALYSGAAFKVRESNVRGARELLVDIEDARVNLDILARDNYKDSVELLEKIN